MWIYSQTNSNRPLLFTGKTLISRLSTQRWLDVGSTWTEDVHKSAHSSMIYEFRVTCDAHYYGNGCASLCRPRDDSFGHYTCSQSGKRNCLPGWSGDYCTKGKIDFFCHCLFFYIILCIFFWWESSNAIGYRVPTSDLLMGLLRIGILRSLTTRKSYIKLFLSEWLWM